MIRELLAEDDCQVNVSPSERLLNLVRSIQIRGDGEIFTRIQTVDNAPGDNIVRRVENGDTDILHFRGYGKAEKDNLHHRHTQQYQHGSPVTEDMEEFLSDKSYKLFHCSY